MGIFHAQPYDLSATGFYFEDQESFEKKIGSIRNDYGQPVEEFELQFIDGEAIDCALARAWGINQANILAFIDAAESWEEDEKLRFIIAVGECGYSFDPDSIDPNIFEVDIYEDMSLRELAEHFVEEGLYGPIPETIAYYLDYEAIANDLGVEYTETEIAGKRWTYACR
ncbi:MAG: antirestriction protein ArdA [Pseudomonadota bacterium]